MNDEKLRKQIGANIVSYRKRGGMTQAGLAEKLNYSDKAVSKWERGESLPDVMTLVQIAELFEISVNDLVADPNALPGQSGPVTRVVEKALKRRANKLIVLLLCSILVWFVALFFFAVLSTCDIAKSWMGFIYAVPVNGIVGLSLLSAWHDFRWNRALISIIMWGSLLFLFATLWVFVKPYWLMFLLGIPGQAAVLLWGRLFHKTKEIKDE